MKRDRIMAQARLEGLLEDDELTVGMCVRVHGNHLILGRESKEGSKEPDDRVRLTRISTRTYGLSVKRHTGRWEKTPFTGTMREMVETMKGLMQHLIADH